MEGSLFPSMWVNRAPHAALSAPAPRTGEAFRALVYAQRAGWAWALVYVIVVGILCGLYAILSPSLDSRLFWIAIVTSPMLLSLAAWGYARARSLARHGLVASGAIEPSGRGYWVVPLGDDATHGQRRVLFSVDHVLEPGTIALVLFHPRRRSAFVWVNRFVTTGEQLKQAAPPQARIHK